MSKIDPRYVRRLEPDENGGYTATIHELPGCIADGDTAEEALQNLESAAESWIEAAKESGYKICPPIDFGGASGKIALRISRRIHQQAAERAALEGTSLNQLISNAVASYLGQVDGIEREMHLIKKTIDRSIKTGPIIIAIAHPETKSDNTNPMRKITMLQNDRSQLTLGYPITSKSVLVPTEWQTA